MIPWGCNNNVSKRGESQMVHSLIVSHNERYNNTPVGWFRFQGVCYFSVVHISLAFTDCRL